MRGCLLITLVAPLLGSPQGEQRELRRSRRPILQGRRQIQQSRRPQLSDIQCQGGGVSVYEDPTSCNNFYLCENGTLSQQTCENGLLFSGEMALSDAVHNYCVYNWKMECGDRPRDDTPLSSPGCEYRFGLFPVGEGCQQSYNQCSFGLPTQTPCENENENIPILLELSYDPSSHTCAWPDQLQNLGCDPQTLFGFTCPFLDEFVGTRNEQFAPFPRFAVEGHPGIYLICVGGQPRLQSCGALDTFDPDTLQCSRRNPFSG